MGLIKAAKDAVETLFADQWREFFYCDAMSSDLLVTKGVKRINAGRNSNTKASDNIITNGSVVAVNEGQCMLIVDQGKIVEICAEAGEFIYDSSTEPSVFYGPLKANVANSFKTFGNRFAFGGNTGKDQRVYYINTKEIRNNPYGTNTPIDFHLMSPKTGLELETTVKCHGQYSFNIVDPVLFYTNVCGNVVDEYKKSEDGQDLIAMMKGELVTALRYALGEIAAQGILPSQLNGHTKKIVESLKSELSAQWAENRGIEVVSITIDATVPDEDRATLNKWNEKVMLTDPGYQQAEQVAAMSKMIGNSKFDVSGGSGGGGASATDAAMGMMAMRMMMNGDMFGGNSMGMQQGGMMQQGQMAPQGQMMQQPTGTPVLGWTCSCGHADNRGKFCAECGSPKPAAAGWTCACGSVNQGKFCSNCGSKKPAGAPLYKCDKCGWEPEDPVNPPKFCPECGDPFDENDVK